VSANDPASDGSGDGAPVVAFASAQLARCDSLSFGEQPTSASDAPTIKILRFSMGPNFLDPLAVQGRRRPPALAQSSRGALCKLFADCLVRRGQSSGRSSRRSCARQNPNALAEVASLVGARFRVARARVHARCSGHRDLRRALCSSPHRSEQIGAAQPSSNEGCEDPGAARIAG
jgi:hypothetical protein